MRFANSSGGRLVAACAILALLGGGCASAKSNPKTTVGAAGGATAGGLIAAAASASPAGIAAGVILGGLLGGAVGNALDQRDKELAMKQAQMSLNTGNSGTWSNPDSGHSGTFTPAAEYTAPDGRQCREYTHDVVIDDKTEKVTGTACRQADGTWKEVD